MSNQPNEGDLGPETLEHLIETAGHGPLTDQSPLTELISAATTPDDTRVHAGEQPAVTAYLAANSENPPVKSNRTPRRRHPAALATTLAALTAVAIATLATINGNSQPEPRHSPPTMSANSTNRAIPSPAPPRSPMSATTATHPNALPSPPRAATPTPQHQALTNRRNRHSPKPTNTRRTRTTSSTLEPPRL